MKSELIKFYSDLYKQYGSDPRSVGWADKQTQELRFYVLSKIGDFKKKKLLDLGSGFGDFYSFLGYSKSYTGVELNPEFYYQARKQHERSGAFFIEDSAEYFLSSDFCEQNEYDYIFASGLFAHIEDWQDLIKNAFESCKEGFAFNMLHTKYSKDQGIKGFRTYDPMEVWKECEKLTNKLTLRQDYLPYDFTFYLYK